MREVPDQQHYNNPNNHSNASRQRHYVSTDCATIGQFASFHTSACWKSKITLTGRARAAVASITPRRAEHAGSAWWVVLSAQEIAFAVATAWEAEVSSQASSATRWCAIIASRRARKARATTEITSSWASRQTLPCIYKHRDIVAGCAINVVSTITRQTIAVASTCSIRRNYSRASWTWIGADTRRVVVPNCADSATSVCTARAGITAGMTGIATPTKYIVRSAWATAWAHPWNKDGSVAAKRARTVWLVGANKAVAVCARHACSDPAAVVDQISRSGWTE